MTDRRTYAPVAALGVASSILAAYAGAQTWLGRLDLPDHQSVPAFGVATAGVGESPATTAFALVLVALWGLILFGRGRLRRAVAVAAVPAALAVVASVVHARITLRDAVDESRRTWPTNLAVDMTWSPWFWIAAGAAVVALATAVLAMIWVRSWPEMGRRYDAPNRRPEPVVDADERAWWNALDDGFDPTL